MTGIDIQTPIPPRVQTLRSGRSLLFIAGVFDRHVQRSFAHQIMKRSLSRHWAVLPDEPTRNEQRFLAEQDIERIGMPLDAFAGLFVRDV